VSFQKYSSGGSEAIPGLASAASSATPHKLLPIPPPEIRMNSSSLELSDEGMMAAMSKGHPERI